MQSMRLMLAFLLKGQITEGVTEQSMHSLIEGLSLRGKPVHLKGVVGKHAAISIDNKDPSLLWNTFFMISSCQHAVLGLDSP